jgi:hypothetical protein
MFVVKNEHFYTISDYGSDTFITWVANSTPESAIFLIPQDSMYNPIRMAGRKTYALSPRYADAFGYDVAKRNTIIKDMYNASDIKNISLLLRQNNIMYVEIPQASPTDFNINYAFYNSFPIVFTGTNFNIVKVP